MLCIVQCANVAQPFAWERQYDQWRGRSLQLAVFFRRGKLDLTPTAYSLDILDENTSSEFKLPSLLWPAFSLPYADSDALQF